MTTNGPFNGIIIPKELATFVTTNGGSTPEISALPTPANPQPAAPVPRPPAPIAPLAPLSALCLVPSACVAPACGEAASAPLAPPAPLSALCILPSADATPSAGGEAALRDPELFARTYLAYYCRHDFNDMHRYSFKEYCRQHAQPLPQREGRRLAIAAPRGAAKSTMHTLIFPLMDILSRRERHIVIISATMAQSQGRLATILRELRHNRALRDAFFDGRPPKIKSTKRSFEFNGVRVEASSAGSEMRGISHGEFRPTRIILDDVEHARFAQRSGGRTRLQAWYDETVENLGDNYTHITIVGTILHSASLLSTLLERPGYKGMRYKSVISWADRQDLWDEWQRLYTDRTDADAPDTARSFYLANEPQMLVGTAVFWPSKEPYIKLMQNRVANGNASFMKEKQNSPLSDDDRIFDTARWNRFICPAGHIEIVPRGFTLEQEAEHRRAMEEAESSNILRRPYPNVKDLKYYGFLDPAVGKSTTRDGDYAAIVTIGRDIHDTLYVVQVWMEKVSPHHQIQQVFNLHQEYNYDLFGFESNGFQETFSRFVKDEQNTRKNQHHRWQLPIEKFVNTTSKHSRIALLEPKILCGSILFQQGLPEKFFVQADEYNGSARTHDDALDAMASCVEMIRRADKNIPGIRNIKRPTLAPRRY